MVLLPDFYPVCFNILARYSPNKTKEGIGGDTKYGSDSQTANKKVEVSSLAGAIGSLAADQRSVPKPGFAKP